MFRISLKILITVFVVSSFSAHAGIKKRELFSAELPTGKNYKMVTNFVTLTEGQSLPHHIHHGIEFGCIESGLLTLYIRGEKTALLHEGECYQVPNKTEHWANAQENTTLVASWVVDVNQPLMDTRLPAGRSNKTSTH
ncbi:cupin domain-containing protein [Vibrio sp. S4M6]|uniref:cupin domain-containing protein n=1 Tax=Vibrio sinus TaxID=2946865 RepID=UPI00202A8EC2|nr:cupin domain-containing protein [Vibrio sinus]MCL9781605.1 cupin domain-containing protein [Vibrio sinus]